MSHDITEGFEFGSQPAFIARLAYLVGRGEDTHRTGASHMMVNAGHQCDPGWCAHGVGVEVGETYTFFSEFIYVGRFYLTAKHTRVCKTQVISQDDDNIWWLSLLGTRTARILRPTRC